MVVAEQQAREYTPFQKNATTVTKINNFCFDFFFAKLIMLFPSGHNKNLAEFLRGLAACLSWKQCLWLLSDLSWLLAVFIKGE